MQVMFVLLFLWTAKLKWHEIYIFARTAKLNGAKFVIFPKKKPRYFYAAKVS